MEDSRSVPSALRFGVFDLDPKAGELRKKGMKVRLQGQPIDILVLLLQRPGKIVTREELQENLWPADTFVDFEQGLNNAMKRLRAALDDDAESPHFIETVPRRGYRFIAPVEDTAIRKLPVEAPNDSVSKHAPKRAWTLRLAILFGGSVLLLGTGFYLYKLRKVSGPPQQRTLTRVTFDDGLQFGATWSPDGRFIAYSSDRGGKFDIWVQQVSGGDPVQVTKGRGNNSQPNWSPDGKYLAYRSEDGAGGLFVVPALGGEGLERKIASFGYLPRWSPDSSQILFQTHFTLLEEGNRFYVSHLDGIPPREVLAEFLAKYKLWPGSAVWHPDGKRITVWVSDPEGPGPSFWTVPIAGGTAIKTEIDPAITKQLAEVAGGAPGVFAPDSSFSWSPSGKALYFECLYRGAISIWKMAIDPESLRAIAIDRLTTGPGPDTGVAISADGRRLAFTAVSQTVRNWLFTFDATTGRLGGNGRAISAQGRLALTPALSRDGKMVAFCVAQPGTAYLYGDTGRSELWEKSLLQGREVPIITDNYARFYPQWSPDGTRLAYTRANAYENQLMVWSSESRSEEPLTTWGKGNHARAVYDWSADGKSLLISQASVDSRYEVWLLPVASAPHAETAAQKIATDPKYDLYQAHFSPNGRWIVFEAVANSPKEAESALYVVPAAGGSWTRITQGKPWDDKPRWSPDGKTIYFVSSRGGFFNVWGIHFDPALGKPVGEPFRVSTFESPSLMVPRVIAPVALSLTEDKLVLTLQELSGGIWVLDNADR
jgi:Tol biopolymer transport system component/DNA-binding winged helix-turn-helix (wHTH) protein